MKEKSMSRQDAGSPEDYDLTGTSASKRWR